MIRSMPAVVFTSNAPSSSMPAVTPLRPFPFDARADRVRRRRAPRLQDITGTSAPSRASRSHSAIKDRGRAAAPRSIGRPNSPSIDVARARNIRRIRGRLHVHADADDDGLIRRADREPFGEDAGQLAPSDEQIVRPLQIGRQSGRGQNAVAHRNTGGQREQRQATGVASGLRDEREIQARSRRRRPRRSAPPAARGLLIGDDHHAMRRAFVRQRGGHIHRRR